MFPVAVIALLRPAAQYPGDPIPFILYGINILSRARLQCSLFFSLSLPLAYGNYDFLVSSIAGEK